MYNGNKVGYVISQLEKLFWIIDNTTKIEEKMGVNAVPRILCTCDSESLMYSVIKRIRNNKTFHVDKIEELLFFNLDTKVWDFFGGEWINIL